MENPKNRPILGIRCAKCGAVYMAQALAYPISSDIAEAIAESVRNGDEPFISYEGVRLGQCTCDDETAEPETEGCSTGYESTVSQPTLNRE